MSETEYRIKEIDVCGQICPSTLLTALREINSHKDALKGGTLQLVILTDNHDSTNRISEAVKHMGYLLEVEDRNDHFKISISKNR